MTSKKYSIFGMHCQMCVNKVTKSLQEIDGVLQAQVSLVDSFFNLKASKDISLDEINSKLSELLGDYTASNYKKQSIVKVLLNFINKYKPILLVFFIIFLLLIAANYVNGEFNIRLSMRVYMASFFIIFSIFKLMNLKNFPTTFKRYDILAKKSDLYAKTYPFIELFLGIGFILGYRLRILNIITLFIMGIGSIGIIKALSKKQQIECACLGGFFKIPISKVTLFEDISMVIMAISMMV